MQQPNSNATIKNSTNKAVSGIFHSEHCPYPYFHLKLAYGMEAYGLDRNSLNLMLSYLSNRIQRVKIGACLSRYSKIKSGVPQGSVLGPLLFNISINNIFYLNLD